MMIFDRFKSKADADAFAAAVSAKHGLEATAYDDRRDDIDPFPFELAAPVVYVERPDAGFSEDERIEREVMASVFGFGGEFAGT